MGLIYPDINNLIETRKGKSGGRVLTLGRLDLYLHQADIIRLKRKMHHDADVVGSLDRYRWGAPADEVLVKLLRLESIDSMDYSDYEGCTIQHDLNTPIPERLRNAYDLVIDGGTIEHVFDFASAIKNLMSLVRVGGSLYWSCPSNNLCGHGFYQFSPELAFRIFSAENGFNADYVRLFTSTDLSIEQSKTHFVYEVSDPATIRRRINILTGVPVTMCVSAVKTADVAIFKSTPLQSDYVQKWSSEDQSAAEHGALKRVVRRYVPIKLRDAVSGWRQRRQASLERGSAFQKLNL